MDKNWEQINEANLKRLVEESENWQKDEWKAVLKNAPTERLFYALMCQIRKALDTIREYQRVPEKIEKAYSEDFYWEGEEYEDNIV